MFVFPTPVGVFLTCHKIFSIFLGLPHARGGVSLLKCDACHCPRLPHARGGVSTCDHLPLGGPSSSPRPWGCFQVVVARTYMGRVFPTPVGVFLMKTKQASMKAGLPHARGGVSRVHFGGVGVTASSPRPWGCFRLSGFERAARAVFPTPVGVFLDASASDRPVSSLPHARGGVSLDIRLAAPEPKSSPRPWGCF